MLAYIAILLVVLKIVLHTAHENARNYAEQLAHKNNCTLIKMETLSINELSTLKSLVNLPNSSYHQSVYPDSFSNVIVYCNAPKPHLTEKINRKKIRQLNKKLSKTQKTLNKPNNFLVKKTSIH